MLLDLFEMRIDKFHGRNLALSNQFSHLRQRESVRHQLEYRRRPRMVLLTALRWDEARDAVHRLVETVPPPSCRISADSSPPSGRVLAHDIQRRSSYPPLSRSMRDGYAVRTINLPGRLRPDR